MSIKQKNYKDKPCQSSGVRARDRKKIFKGRAVLKNIARRNAR